MKHTVKEDEKQTTIWVKIFANRISYTEPVSRIYKGILKTQQYGNKQPYKNVQKTEWTLPSGKYIDKNIWKDVQ